MFDVGFQRAVLRLVMIDEAFAQKVFSYLDPSHFTAEPLGWVFKTMKTLTAELGAMRLELPVRDSLRNVSADKQALYMSEVDAICALGPVSEEAYIRRELREFCRRSIFAVAHRDAATLFNAGDHVKAYDVMARAQDTIQQITFDVVDRQFFFEELLKRQHDRIRASLSLEDAFTTGIPELDALTGGGVHRGELWCVLAYAKRCKTTWLINQGFLFTRVHRQPVLHFVLEGSGKQIAARYDSCFSSELYTAVKKGEIDQKLYSVLLSEYQALRSLLVIRTLNDWDVTVEHLNAEIQELKVKRFVPVGLIVDYVDLMRSRYQCSSEMEHQLASSRDLKRLINQHGFAGWSAWQAQRPSKGAETKEHILMASQVADCYGKVRIVDAYGSLNATDEEMHRDEMRVFWEGYRDAEVSRLFNLRNDLGRQRMAVTSSVATTPAVVSS